MNRVLKSLLRNVLPKTEMVLLTFSLPLHFGNLIPFSIDTE
jgi:hypothetical protein